MNKLALLPILLLTSAACGGKDLCSKFAKDAEECGQETSKEELKECQDAMDPCTNSDQKHLVKYFECLEDVSFFSMCGDDETEEPSMEDLDAMSLALLTCTEEVEDISESCLAVAGLSSDFTYDATYSTTSSY